jgi:hypothetical protein
MKKHLNLDKKLKILNESLEKKNTQLILILISVILFFSFSMILCHDSVHYLSYIEIFEGKQAISTWDVVRGPTFPIIIFISNLLFGKMPQGLLISNFLWFGLLAFTIKLLCSKIFENSSYKNLKTLLVIVICCFNPMIFGYYHVLLTECYAITLILIVCCICYKWIYIKLNMKSMLLYSLLIAVLIEIIWFLKQPYLFYLLLPLLFCALFGILENKTIKAIIYYLLTIAFCFIFLLCSIKVWNQFLESNGVTMNNGRESSDIASNSLLTGVRIEMSKTTINNKNADDFKFINETKKQEIINKILPNEEYYLLNINNVSYEVIDQDIIKANELGKISILQSLGKQISIFSEHPIAISSIYFQNYCAISSICKISTEDGVGYKLTSNFDYTNAFENNVIPYRTYTNLDNVFYIPDNWQYRVINYRQVNNPGIFKNIEVLIQKPTNIIYKLTIIFSPIFFLLSLIERILFKKNKEKNKIINLSIILISCGFGGALLNSSLGAFIDRYAIEALIPGLLGIIVLIRYNLLVFKKK